MSDVLAGRRVLVTGGARGLGAGMGAAMAAAGASVMFADITKDVGEQTAAGIADTGATARFVALDVTDDAQWEAAVAHTVDELGGLDVVVNNAGIVRDRMLFSMTEADFDAVIGVHLKGTFAVSRHACAYWRAAAKRGEPVAGRIINTTSGTGLFGNVGQANYGAAKAGIANLTVITALEMRRYGVTANAISPIAATRMTADLAVASGDVVDGFDPRDPANASGLVVYLASPASGWLTGQILRVDGATVNRLRGWTVTDSYRSGSNTAVTADELVEALPQLYGTAPTGRVSVQ
jgi:NAD(P)-dependent dehydrogenase (short-subunit alcohol dehydrogenase family)